MTSPNISLSPIGKKFTKGKKVRKTIFANKGTRRKK